MERGQEGVMGRDSLLQEASEWRQVGLLLEVLEPGDRTYLNTQGTYTLPTVKVNTPVCLSQRHMTIKSRSKRCLVCFWVYAGNNKEASGNFIHIK